MRRYLFDMSGKAIVLGHKGIIGTRLGPDHQGGGCDVLDKISSPAGSGVRLTPLRQREPGLAPDLSGPGFKLDRFLLVVTLLELPLTTRLQLTSNN